MGKPLEFAERAKAMGITYAKRRDGDYTFKKDGYNFRVQTGDIDSFLDYQGQLIAHKQMKSNLPQEDTDAAQAYAQSIGEAGKAFLRFWKALDLDAIAKEFPDFDISKYRTEEKAAAARPKI